MRCTHGIIVAVASLGLAGCAIAAMSSAKHTIANTKDCMEQTKESPEGRVVYARLWSGDETTADKLTDTRPLTKPERDAYVVVHNKVVQCRQLNIDHDNH